MANRAGRLRRALFFGTALATSFGILTAATDPAEAQQAIFRPAAVFPVNANNANNCVFIGSCVFINTIGPGASINLTNSGNFATIGIGASSIVTNTNLGGRITIDNSGNLATAGDLSAGIFANTVFGGRIAITNTGDIATAGFGSAGIFANTIFGGGINITNEGDIATAGLGSAGIFANTIFRGDVNITNHGDVATIGLYSAGIVGTSFFRGSDVTIANTGDVFTRGAVSVGIAGFTYGRNADISITNEAKVTTRGLLADGIFGLTLNRRSDIHVLNTGEVNTRAIEAEGIYVSTYGRNADIVVENQGKIETTGRFAEGINALTYSRGSDITITNSGEIKTNGRLSDGIYAYTGGRDSNLLIHNAGSIHAEGRRAFGIFAVSTGRNAPTTIVNSGDVKGTTVGIYSYSATSTQIENTGKISAGSGLAIDTVRARSTINNSGLITGFVDLTRRDDIFRNKAGGEFRATDTSNFRAGEDLFLNRSGGTVRTATKSNRNEHTRFIGLERFENRGTITMQDGKIGDKFTISNTRGGKDLTFKGSGASTLTVDSFLGGPGSRSDVFVVEGKTKGRTRVSVNNVNRGPGELNRQGIPVVFVEGNVKKSNFFLKEPIDTGFFDYDLVFKRTGSGQFDLKSHAGGGSHVLPHVISGSHETFHSSTETWFDQTTDLRALLARGSVCDDIAHPEERIRCQDVYDATPAIWARGAGSWYDIEDTGTTKANGRSYRYDLSRDLDIWQVESGIDFGKEDVLSPDDILVFGVLGGAVESRVDFDALARSYEFSNLEVGAYATYLRGGFFFDTLFKAFFGTLEPEGAAEFPETLDTQTYGLRADTGYRFGGVQDGPFFEPLATLAVSWTHIDDFTRAGTAIDFSDDEQVRGRLGMRAGTSMQIWEGTTFEPFVVGSLWGLLSDDHRATVTSNGTTFAFADKPDDVWGEVSGGVNFFNPDAQSAIFAKVDYIFAEDTEGVSAKGGMRVTW